MRDIAKRKTVDFMGYPSVRDGVRTVQPMGWRTYQAHGLVIKCCKSRDEVACAPKWIA